MNLFVENIILTRDYRVFKKFTRIDFRPGITLLVGDQGSGKSTILSLLSPLHEKSNDSLRTFKCDNRVQVFSFDTEKDNPRIKGRIENKFQIAAVWSSHGETMRAIHSKIDTEKDVLFMIDEPEAGLSLRSQYELIEKIKKSIENGCQLILATHSLILMQEFGNIFDLEKMEYTTFDDFIDRQKNGMWTKPPCENSSLL